MGAIDQLRAQIRRGVIPVADLQLSQQPQGALWFPDDLPPRLAVMSGLSAVDGTPKIVRVNADGTIGTAAAVTLFDATALSGIVNNSTTPFLPTLGRNYAAVWWQTNTITGGSAGHVYIDGQVDNHGNWIQLVSLTMPNASNVVTAFLGPGCVTNVVLGNALRFRYDFTSAPSVFAAIGSICLS